jgi:hypothetical protein
MEHFSDLDGKVQRLIESNETVIALSKPDQAKLMAPKIGKNFQTHFSVRFSDASPS